jgi:hypothetical protein
MSTYIPDKQIHIVKIINVVELRAGKKGRAKVLRKGGEGWGGGGAGVGGAEGRW